MKSLLIVFIFSAVAHADDIRVITLSDKDNQRFNKTLTYLTTREVVFDSENNANWYHLRNFVSENEALKMNCSTKFMAGSEVSATCFLEFNLTKSNDALQVFEGKLAGAIVARLNNPNVATKLNRGTGNLPFVSLEKVNIKLPDGKIQASPRLRIDCEKVANSGGIAKSCTLVTLPDQNE